MSTCCRHSRSLCTLPLDQGKGLELESGIMMKSMYCGRYNDELIMVNLGTKAIEECVNKLY